MNFLNEQAQLFMVSAGCFAIGLWLMWLALIVYSKIFDRALKLFGVHAALAEMVLKGRKRWWYKAGTWGDKL